MVSIAYPEHLKTGLCRPTEVEHTFGCHLEARCSRLPPRSFHDADLNAAFENVKMFCSIDIAVVFDSAFRTEVGPAVTVD